MMRSILISLLVSILAFACAERPPYYPYITHCSPGMPGDVVVMWLGVAGIQVTDGSASILVDPFVSQRNASFRKIASGSPLITDRRAVERWTSKISSATDIFITHSHYDHSMDAPAFAEALQAVVHGGSTTGYIMEGHGQRDRFRLAKEGQVVRVGDFEVKLVRSQHGAGLLFGVPFKGMANAPILPGSPASAYRVGEVFSLEISHPQGTLLYFGSGGSRTGMFDSLAHPAVALLTMSARTDTDSYIAHAVIEPNARKVVPIHFDDLFSPPIEPPRVQSLAMLDEFADRLAIVDRSVAFEPQPLGSKCAIFRGLLNKGDFNE